MSARSASRRRAAISCTRPAWRSSPARLAAPRSSMSPAIERQRRHATLVATTLDLTASLTDQAIELFDRLVGAMFRKAEGRQARAFHSDARAINEKVRLYAKCRRRADRRA